MFCTKNRQKVVKSASYTYVAPDKLKHVKLFLKVSAAQVVHIHYDLHRLGLLCLPLIAFDGESL